MLFTLFGEVVFKRGSTATGLIWSAAGVGLVLGGLLSHRIGERLSFKQYKHAVTLSFLVMGLSYMTFSLMPTIWGAMVFIALSRVAMGTNSVLNRTILLTHVPDALRGRVFTSVDVLLNSSMMLSMGAAGMASVRYSPRQIGVAAGLLTASTALFWAWANAAGKLTEPAKSAAPRETGASRRHARLTSFLWLIHEQEFAAALFNHVQSLAPEQLLEARHLRLFGQQVSALRLVPVIRHCASVSQTSGAPGA